MKQQGVSSPCLMMLGFSRGSVTTSTSTLWDKADAVLGLFRAGLVTLQ